MIPVISQRTTGDTELIHEPKRKTSCMALLDRHHTGGLNKLGAILKNFYYYIVSFDLFLFMRTLSFSLFLLNTSATLLITEHRDIKIVPKPLGHYTTMKIYAHSLQQSDKKADQTMLKPKL